MNTKRTDTAAQEALAAELRAEAGRARIGQAALARAAGTGTQTMYRYMNGTRDIPFDVMVKMCAELGVSVGTLVDRAVAAVESELDQQIVEADPPL